MQKSAVMMVIVGALVAAGIILSFYGSHVITEGLSQKEGQIMPGQSLEITSDIDISASSLGVFVVQVHNPKEGTIHAKVFDPFGAEIISSAIDKESVEKRFDVAASGTYKLLIENTGGEQAQVIAVIGPMPETDKLSLGIIGFYVLIVGLAGIVGVGIYVIRNRRKNP